MFYFFIFDSQSDNRRFHFFFKKKNISLFYSIFLYFIHILSYKLIPYFKYKSTLSSQAFSCCRPSLRSIPTMDRISDFPDSILCHIISFLPTNLASITSILSKRWKSVWLLGLTLNFDHESFEDFNSFQRFFFLTLFSLRDKKILIRSFNFKCGESSCFNQKL